MRAVARLLFTYFAGTRAQRWLAVAALLLIAASLYVVLYLPQTERMLAFAVPGLIALFLSTATMPLTLGRLARSHAACILPGARIKLVVSAILTVLLVALPAGLLAPLAYVAGMSADVNALFENPSLWAYTSWLAGFTFTSACIAAAWLYVIIWLVGNERNMSGYTKAAVLVLVLMIAPSRSSQDVRELLRSSLLELVALTVVFTVGLLFWPSIRGRFAGFGRSRPAAAGRARELAGTEVDLLLGNSRPWPLVAALLVPILVLARQGDLNAAFSLFYLAIASTIVGAFAGQAPARSRALWLRGDWSRPALFSAIEKSAWRHNGLVLVVLMLVFLGLGSYAKFPMAVMAFGIPLLMIGAVLSTYLGLMLTRGVRWPEATLGVLTMMALMVIALMLGGSEVNFRLMAGLLSTLAALAVVLRTWARNRWAHIDWSQCRNETQRALRAG